MASKIVINGRVIVVQGNGTSVNIRNGQVVVNGQVLADGLSGVVEIKWEGPAASVHSDASIACGAVQGDVTSGGSVTAGNVEGNVQAGGSVHCKDVCGSVMAGGSVHRS